MSLEYVIYTDESEKRGKFYSNFYGGVLVQSPDLQPMIDRLEKCKTRLNLHQEVKWQKVTENYLEKGETTGKGGDWANLWHHPYRHWKFIPAEHEVDSTKTKK